MKTKTRMEILDHIKRRGEASPDELVTSSGFSNQAIHRHLKTLLASGELEKLGSSPWVFYRLREKRPVKFQTRRKGIETEIKFIDKNFFAMSPDGRTREGFENGFVQWCFERNLDVTKTARNYVKTLKRYSKYRKGGLINGTLKLRSTFGKNICLKKLYYLDFYAIERFGKTKLGSMILHAKLAESSRLGDRVVELTKPRLEKFIAKKKFDALGFIPPSIPRKVQLMSQLEKAVSVDVPRIRLVKAITEEIVPQKSLSRVEDRVINVRNTIFVPDNREYKNILLIDDATASGATVNEVARKLQYNLLKGGKVTAITLVGSFKGFTVISGI